jgi:cysteine-rich repeat protein
MRKLVGLVLCAVVGCGDNSNVNAPPELASPRINLTMSEDRTLTIDATAQDPEGVKLTYLATQPQHGTLIGSGPIYTYTPTANYNGEDGFTVEISDGVNSLSVPVTITVSAIDDPPVAGDVQATTDENQGVAVALAGTDVDSTTLSYQIVAQPAHGSLTGVAPQLTYTPSELYFGADSFTYQVSDGEMLSNTATVNITVAHVLTCGDGIMEGAEQCDDGNTSNTDGCLNNCMIATCGDGFIETGVEQCDDGNGSNTDACLNTCVIARCGDGFTEAGVEQCDDGNTSNTDACLNTCQSATCGDGFVEIGLEQCDNGVSNSNNGACLTTCAIATCGDGFVETGVEQCDDGNTSNNDACLNTCQSATCGDGFVRIGVEQCDDGNRSNNDACLNTCAIATCGDGFVFTGFEQCDDGNRSNNDACLNTCVNAFCGDGFVRIGFEQCDDANASNNDACLNTCVIATCGDGFVRTGVEQCDDGNNSNNDACLNTCTAASCGDGFVRIGVEQCDDGNNSNNDGCLNTCVAASCGDGFVRTGVEQCDDGNNSNNDACLNTCANASCGDGFVRIGVEQCDDANNSNIDGCLNTCVLAVCGDGFVEAGVEQCDDGNTNNNDGCRNDCTQPVCGDGILDAGEECDDGNTDDDDGCGHSCKIERCGDGLVQFSRGEECDDGNMVSGDGCDSNCLAEAYTTTTAVLISGALNCTTGVASSTHKVAVDSDGRIYAVFMCGTSGFTVISTDRGQTYSSPTDLTAPPGGGTELQISQIAIGTGEVGTAYAALLLTSGNIVLRTSTDFGTTWGPLVPIGTASNTSSGLSLDAFNDDVYIGFETSNGVSVFHSRDQASSFTSSLAPLTTADFDLTYDIRTRTVAVAASSPPSFRVLISNDMGQTWSTEVNPPGQEFFSDWAMSNGQLFVSGTNIGILGNSTQLYVIPTSSPTTSTAISGLPQVTTLQSRSLTADAAGNVYVCSQRDAGTIEIDRLQFGAVSFDSSDALPGNGTEPVCAPLPGSNGVVVIYTQGGNQVWATVQSPASGGGGGIPGG